MAGIGRYQRFLPKPVIKARTRRIRQYQGTWRASPSRTSIDRMMLPLAFGMSRRAFMGSANYPSGSRSKLAVDYGIRKEAKAWNVWSQMGQAEKRRIFRRYMQQGKSSYPSTGKMFKFADAVKVAVCTDRRIRKEVMHAKGHAGKVGQRSPVWSQKSKIICK